jgi:hypothetical protein
MAKKSAGWGGGGKPSWGWILIALIIATAVTVLMSL